MLRLRQKRNGIRHSDAGLRPKAPSGEGFAHRKGDKSDATRLALLRHGRVGRGEKSRSSSGAVAQGRHRERPKAHLGQPSSRVEPGATEWGRKERDRALNQSGYMGSLSGSQQQGRSTRYSPLIRTRRLQAIDGHQCENNSRPRSKRAPRRPQALQCDTGCKASNVIKHRQPIALVLGHGF